MAYFELPAETTKKYFELKAQISSSHNPEEQLEYLGDIFKLLDNIPAPSNRIGPWFRDMIHIYRDIGSIIPEVLYDAQELLKGRSNLEKKGEKHRQRAELLEQRLRELESEFLSITCDL